MIAKVESPAMAIRSIGSIWTATRRLIRPPLPFAMRLSSALEHALRIDAGRDEAVHQHHPVLAADRHFLLPALPARGAAGAEAERARDRIALVGRHRQPDRVLDGPLALVAEIDPALGAERVERLLRLGADLRGDRAF